MWLKALFLFFKSFSFQMVKVIKGSFPSLLKNEDIRLFYDCTW